MVVSLEADTINCRFDVLQKRTQVTLLVCPVTTANYNTEDTVLR